MMAYLQRVQRVDVTYIRTVKILQNPRSISAYVYNLDK